MNNRIMKPIIKNFTGKFQCGTRYRIVTRSDCDYVYVVLETYNNGLWHYQTQELAPLNKGYKKGLIEALRNAEAGWGFKLLKEEIKQVA